jgi:hypothetical protein
MAYECKGRYQIMAYLMPARYQKTAQYISKVAHINGFAADGAITGEKSYHISDTSSKDRGQTCRRSLNALKAPPDTEHSIKK